MEDLERYSDYNDYEVDAPRSKNIVTLIIKILIGIVCISVVGVLVFRMIFFNYYPDAMKNIYFTDNLTKYYEEMNGDINAETQDLRFPYDDADYANFFCDNLIVVKGAGELQISVRYNTSAMEAISKASSIEGLKRDDPELLSFRLYDNYDRVYESLSYSEYDSALMYNYYKLAFDGIKFDGEAKPEWIRLEIFVKGQKDTEKPFSMIPIYENHETYSSFEPYEIKTEVLPK